MGGAKFYPWDLYKKVFGDPKSALNRRRGHKVCSVANGTIRGVAVPKEMPKDEPWDLDTEYIDKLGLEDELEVRGSQDSEDFEGEMEQKYRDMAQQDHLISPSIWIDREGASISL